MTERELAELLQSNPDLAIAGDEHMQPNPARANEPVRVSKRQVSEHDLQVAVIAECDRRAMLRSEYGLIFAIPNGGHRHPAVAAKLKAEGVRAGVLDLFLPVARHGYHGLFIELKCGGNKPTQAQQEWIRNLRAEGYHAAVIWDSVDDVIGLIEWYLGDQGHATG